MRDKDTIGVLLGLAGFIFSLIALLRSLSADRRARAIALRQKRQEAFALAVQAQTTVMATRRALGKLQYDAKLARDEAMAKEVDGFITSLGHHITLFSKARSELMKELPDSNDAEEKLQEILDRGMREFKEFELTNEDARDFIDNSQRNLELNRLVKALHIDRTSSS
jgi:hypothetical protein